MAGTLGLKTALRAFGPGMTTSAMLVQRLVQHRLELRQVLRHQTGGGRRRRRATGVARTRFGAWLWFSTHSR